MVLDFSNLDFILESEQAKAMIEYLMREYANRSVENARSLLKFSNYLVDTMLSQTAKRNNELYHAGKMLVFQRSMPENIEKTDPSTAFATMVPVCMALYPKGTVDNESEAHRRYFSKFLELFHNKKAFDWKKDKRWAETFGYADYLRLVEENEKKQEET